MQTRYLGASGLQVSALSFGSMTFGGADEYFGGIGQQGRDEARRMVDICLDAGINLFDTSDIYSGGLAEEILGDAIAGRRDRLLVATKVRFPTGEGPNDGGLSRHHLIEGVEASLRRLEVDHIDLLQLHEIDPATPLEETMRALDDLVRSGKVRYLGVSNFSAWMIMKALAISESRNYDRFVAHQAYYSLACRDIEFELIPCAEAEGFGHIVWSPLAGGFLSGKFRRGQAEPEDSRRGRGFGDIVPIEEERGLDVVEVAAEIAAARGVSVAQVCINWLLGRPTVASIVVGARREEQLLDNLKAVEWELDEEERRRLDEVSEGRVPYPQWHQRNHASADRAVGPNRVAIAP